MVILEIIRPEVSWKFSWEESTSQSVEKLTQWTLLSGDNPSGQLRIEEELGSVYIFTVKLVKMTVFNLSVSAWIRVEEVSSDGDFRLSIFDKL